MRPLGFYTILMLALVLTSLAAPLARASGEGAPIIFEGIDISPAVSYFKKLVVTLKTPVTIYNWSPGAQQPFWNHDHAPNDLNLLDISQSWSQSFWQSYGEPKGMDNMYGTGLYGAVDPVVTVGFGGGLSTQILLQMDLPKGFKMLDLGNPGFSNLSPPHDQVSDIETHFGCPVSRDADKFFENGGASLSQECKRLVRKLFQDLLPIDGFAYGYSKTNFKACSAGAQVGDRAFVIVRPEWMQSDLIHFYTPKMTSDLEGRIRVQTLFLMALEDRVLPTGGISFSKIAEYLTAHPESNLRGSKTKCSDSDCVITVHFCDSKNICDDVALDPIPRPYGPLITSAEASKTELRQLLWPDMENQPKTDTASEWIKKNEFGCSGTLPYNTEPAK